MRKIFVFFYLLLAVSVYGQPDYAWLLNNSTAAQAGSVTLTSISGAVFSTSMVEGTHSANVDNNSGNRFETSSNLSFGSSGLTIFLNFMNYNDGATFTTRTLIDTRINGTGKGLWIYADLDVQKVVVHTNDGSTTGTAETATGLWVPSAGQWVSVGVRFMSTGGNYAKIFVNGTQSGTDSTIQSGWVADAIMAIGCDRAGAAEKTFWGRIDNIHIYTCALSDAEMTALYTNRATYVAASCPEGEGCDPIIGGTVADSQTIDPGDDVAAFTSSVAASGGSGAITYQWQYSNTSSTAGVGTWYDIGGATSATYNHGTLINTTYFTRKAIDALCGNGYSNVLKITVTGSTPPTEDLHKWYFSNSGSDANSGHSEDVPLESMAKLQSLLADSVDAGDTIFLSAGDEWDEVSLYFGNSVAGTYGNEIVITSYGDGARPKLKGTKVVPSFSASGNIWRANVPTLPTVFRRSIQSRPDMWKQPVFLGLFIDGTYYAVGKHPNSGYYTAESSGPVTVNGGPSFSYIQDNNMSWTPDNKWSDGCISVSTCPWVQATMEITSSTSNRLYLSYSTADYEPNSCNGTDMTPNYAIINSEAALDQFGEHSYDHSSQVLSVYSAEDLNTKTVEVTNSDTIIHVESTNYIKFKGLEIVGAYMINVQILGGYGITIDDCKITHSQFGINVVSDSCTISNCEILDMIQEGIGTSDSKALTIESNIIKRIGMNFPGTCRNGGAAGIRTYYRNNDTQIKYNRIDSTSYCGIVNSYADASYSTLIYGNMISNFLMYKSDGAGIYTSADTIYNANKIIRRNIVFNSGSASWESKSENYGIYLDAGSWNWKVDSNTIYNVNQAIYLHAHDGCHWNTVHDNLLVKFNLSTKDYYQAGIYAEVPSYCSPSEWCGSIRYLDLKYNYIVVTDSGRSYGLTWNAGSGESAVTSTGSVMDSNYYFNPFRDDDKALWFVKAWVPYASYTVANWYSAFAFEENSTFNQNSWVYDDVSGITEDEFVWVWRNCSNVEHEFDLGDCAFIDLDGVSLTTTLTLQPYTTKVAFYVSGDLDTVDDPLNDEFVEEAETPAVITEPAISRRTRIFIIL